MMTLRELLELHDRHCSQEALVDNLGDGWLMAHNPIFRSVRTLARRAGYGFSSEAALVRDYVALDLLCLEEIVEGGVVPYVDNVSPLRHFAARAPEARIGGGFLAQSIRSNVVLHEAAHAIAHRAIFERRALRDAAAMDPPGFLLRMSLAEAFANAVEDQAAQLSNRRPHGFFFKINSHFGPGLSDPEDHRALVDRFGPEGVLRGAIAAYLLPNLRPEARATTPDERRAVLRWMRGPDGEAGDLAADARFARFCDRPLSLCPSFRTSVAEAHFAYLGMSSALTVMSSIDVLGALEDDRIAALGTGLARRVLGEVE